MSEWNPLNVENLVRAQCIFVGVGNYRGRFMSPEVVQSTFFDPCLNRAGDAMEAHSQGRDYAFVSNLCGAPWSRLVLLADTSDPRCEQFGGAEYLLALRHQERSCDGYSPSASLRVRNLFESIETALLEEGFPAVYDLTSDDL